MLSRFISKPSNHHLRLISVLVSTQPHHSNHPYLTNPSPQTPIFPNPNFNSLRHFVKHFSTNNKNNNGNSGNWNPSSDIEDSASLGGVLDNEGSKKGDGQGNDLFKVGGAVRKGNVDWLNEKEEGSDDDLFKRVEGAFKEVPKAGLGNQNGVNEKEEDSDYDLFKGVEGGLKKVQRSVVVNEDWVNEKEDDEEFDLFKGIEGSVKEVQRSGVVNKDWVNEKEEDEEFDLFKGIEGSVKEVGGDGVEENWATADGYKAWDLDSEDGVEGEVGNEESEKIKEENLLLEKEEKELSVVLKGPDRAFGDLVATSGITEEMLESLIALKDLEGIQGLPPLSEIEDIRYEKNTRKTSRADIERQKQEEVANARVRQVDSKGRAYGTGKRKCSIARVWIQPGEGKFVVNDKQFDVYFPMLDQRAALLRPFTETKTLGLWDVNCTVKGGGISGQVGAIRLGISRALQNWEPDLRPPLKEAGFLTRDSRVVERKKPGKAKARKSFQWVKR
ncbi:28S ribosomal protein S9, mitochondrial [Heracleum sosnowskyi]|uniref:28S ribosomal protein S9, mitochondrial n=1 Tax=Heracleum sosnowskyi TaxID=360622 RepID=A0AAD8I5F3_9APIA|nr:28S ribosomal protein S9, mitochondrial [Heracleum sosnowskyi]